MVDKRRYLTYYADASGENIQLNDHKDRLRKRALHLVEQIGD